MKDPLIMPTSLNLASDEVLAVARCGHHRLCQVRPGTEASRRVMDFIRRRFLQAYGARPDIRPLPLMVLVNAHGTLLAAVGVRWAASDRLFLEDYLDHPIERTLPAPGCCRDKVLEIAHLAGVEAGVSRVLFAAMALWLEQHRLDWVVCTGTDQLRNGFQRMGIHVEDLGSARPERLAAGGDDWGCYYQHNPRVMAMNVTEGLASLRYRGLMEKVALVSAEGPEKAITSQCTEGRYGYIA
ncbi:thermostable hemolysin [Marinobacter lacisalsi]|uniref:Thermostable hemolysin n=1 Tax=Marinobacter lacisalsi TaxID=475979 RepID=A0ABV8QL96_9GAMM